MFTKRLNGMEQLERKDLFAGLVEGLEEPVVEQVLQDVNDNPVQVTISPDGISAVHGPVVGDVNDDGVFNRRDLIQILHEGKYRTGEPATLTEGDLNDDGMADRVDLIHALRHGDYKTETTAESGPVIGDLNDDGVFNKRDLVHMLQAGKYRTGEPAGPAEGDINGDGVANRLDVVFALQHGDYRD